MGRRRIIKAVVLWLGSMLLIYSGFLFTREQVAKDLRRPECWEPTAEVTVQPVRLPLCSSLADQNLGGGYRLLFVYLCFWMLEMGAFVIGVTSLIRQLQQL